MASECGVPGRMGSCELERRRRGVLADRAAKGGEDNREQAEDVQEEISKLKNPR